jgi:hypothetical protein
MGPHGVDKLNSSTTKRSSALTRSSAVDRAYPRVVSRREWPRSSPTMRTAAHEGGRESVPEDVCRGVIIQPRLIGGAGDDVVGHP